MQQVLLVVQVLIAASLIGIILIQRSDTVGFGLGSGSGSNLLSGRATANLLTRTTAILATLFLLNSLALSIFAARGGHQSIVEQIQQQEKAPAVPGAPVVPTPGTSPSSTLDLRRDAQPAAEKAIQKNTETTKPAAATTEKKAPAVPAAQ